jgi:hypothetical protein
MKNLERLWDLSKYGRDTKWAHTTGKMVLTDLFDAELRQTFNLWKAQYP